MVRSTVKKPNCIVIAGPTASGKSAYALKLAQQMDGEIICADSRQIFERMHIGTASPSDAELAQVKHHGYNCIDPLKKFDAAQFVSLADKLIDRVRLRGKLPILVGGSGLYLKALRYGLTKGIEKDVAVRKNLELEAKTDGLHKLYERLQKIDPPSAKKINKADQFRIVRALEIFEISGEVPSKKRQGFETKKPRFDAKWLLILPKRKDLLPKIEQRAKQMFEDGLIEEAVALQSYLGQAHPLCQTMGYAEALAQASGTMTFEAALERTIIRQRQYAKRQATWFQGETFWEKLI